jgi:hypothetical protein
VYLLFLDRCQGDNEVNLRDPNHDYMEWNHTLPQCLYGDQKWGQWLTLPQHAVASALQTLAFGRCCLHGKHLKFLPDRLWTLTKPFYDALAVENLGKMTPDQFKRGQEKKIKTQTSPDYDWEGVRRANGTYDVMVESGKKQVEEGKGIHDPLHRPIYAKLGGETQGRNNVVNKTGMFKRTSEELSAVSKKNRSRRFRCLITGIESNDTGLTKIQNRLGIDTSNRIQIN